MSPTFVARSFNIAEAKKCGITNIDWGVLTLVCMQTLRVYRIDSSTIRAPLPTYNTLVLSMRHH